jgi:hypothetical protein
MTTDSTVLMPPAQTIVVFTIYQRPSGHSPYEAAVLKLGSMLKRFVLVEAIPEGA